MKDRIVITIDGLAGSGKTSISKLLAERLGFIYFSTGLLYRAVALLAFRHGLKEDNLAELVKLIDSGSIQLQENNGKVIVLIDGEDPKSALYTEDIASGASSYAAKPEVRAALVSVQRNAFPGKNMIAEGRDMGTVIFPEAPLKFFVEVDEEERAARRVQQIIESEDSQGSSRDKNLLYQEILQGIRTRDQRDQERSIAPTLAAEDAVIVKNMGQTLTQVVQKMYDSAAKLVAND